MTESVIYPYPDHWKLTTLGKLCSENGGGIQTGPFGSQLHASDYVEIGVPSIMPKNISVEGVSTDDIAKITEEDAKRLSRYLVKEGDIVYSRRGDVEKCSLITKNESGWLCGTGCLKVDLGENSKVPPAYLHAYLSHPSIREWVSRHAIGATMPNLNTSILSDVPVLIPTEKEINVIMGVWRNTTDKIILNRQINQTLEQMAQAIFKSWFVDFDPVRAKMEGRDTGLPAHIADLFPNELVDSEFGEIPKGWWVKTIADVTSHIVDHRGKTPLKLGGEWVDDGIPAISAKNVKSGRIVNRESIRFVRQELYQHWMKDELEAGDILLTSEGPMGEMYFVSEGEKFCLSQRLFGIRSDKKLSTPTYLYLWLNSDRSRAELESRATGTTVVGVRQSELRKLTVLSPQILLLNAFESLVNPIYKKIFILENEVLTLSALRGELLPKLLSGEISPAADERGFK